ncbi:uncharacterized protein At5g39865 [Amborella trichopoda]|uniref:Glutaredoxin domain-containing protein n=1 Tax=Amborella trichopoda TaxID=13333 RepID=W1NF21_AMBTC|nr:uncharacterized protein At5g39865 [Amborella trichopoda]XP_020519164.1 uncharacterized protein At5g39865 [Amborella trichopoda]ERM94397.1 hypothetical protein AMTR_s00010p00253600 [Amborella trichopoda]|eukprot:XP_006827160.1 uncharacterized protein At5g39865 [Amborella trichopoda]
MGCAGSKVVRRRARANPSSPLTRSFSMPVHHPAREKGHSRHVVALTSTTYGTLKMDMSPVKEPFSEEEDDGEPEEKVSFKPKKACLDPLLEASAKILFDFSSPKKPVDEEPETINTWELMAGLEDTSPLHPNPVLDRSFSFHTTRDLGQVFPDPLYPAFKATKPMDIKAIEPTKPIVSIPMEPTAPLVSEPTDPMDPKAIGPTKTEPTKSVEPKSTDPTEPILFQPKSMEPIEPQFEPIEPSPKGSIGLDSKEEEAMSCIKPLWMQPQGESILSDFDPEVMSTFRKALEELSPKSSDRAHGSWTTAQDRLNGPKPKGGIVQSRVSTFQDQIDSRLARKAKDIGKIELNSNQNSLDSGKNASDTVQSVELEGSCMEEEGVVVYYTSLRGIRKTFEDCCNVRLILQGFRVVMDERDVSMHSRFKEELKARLGGVPKGGGASLNLPLVFVRGRCIGGAEEIKRIHENGGLGRILEGLPTVREGGCVSCEGCGGVKFVPCGECYGSRKVIFEDGALQRCPRCNENGIVRCPLCC